MIKKKYSLILTSQKLKLSKQENILLVKPDKYYLDNFKSKLINFHNNSKKLNLRIKKIEKFYVTFSKILSLHLNKLMGFNYDTKIWQIIYGKWLRDFIIITESYFSILIRLFKTYNIRKVYINNTTDFDFSTNNTLSSYKAFRDRLWFYSYISIIFSNLFKKDKRILIIKKKLRLKSFKEKNYDKNNFTYFFKTLLNRTTRIFKKKNQPLIINTYLPFFLEKYLEISNFFVPQIYFERKIKYSNTNLNLRKSFFLKSIDKANKYQEFLKRHISKFLPKYLLEDFHKINLLSKSNNYPKNPKFIFTSDSFAYDEVFKFYTANKVFSKKIPLYIGQHGNNIFTRVEQKNEPELNYSKNYFSWGYSKKKNIIPLFNFRTINKNYENRKKEKLIFVFDDVGTLPKDQFHENNMIKQIKQSKLFVESLDKKIKKETILRLKPSMYESYFGKIYSNDFTGLNVKIDNGISRIEKLFNVSKLVVFNYDSTGILENYILGIPSIMLINKSYLNYINKDFLNKYKILKKNNLLFYDHFELSKHISKIWPNVEKWWNSKQIQSAIKFFNLNYNNKYKYKNFFKLKKILHGFK